MHRCNNPLPEAYAPKTCDDIATPLLVRRNVPRAEFSHHVVASSLDSGNGPGSRRLAIEWQQAAMTDGMKPITPTVEIAAGES
jgi:hypothetical protein